MGSVDPEVKEATFVVPVTLVVLFEWLVDSCYVLLLLVGVLSALPFGEVEFFVEVMGFTRVDLWHPLR